MGVDVEGRGPRLGRGTCLTLVRGVLGCLGEERLDPDSNFKPKGSMYPSSIYLGLKGVPIQ